MSVTIEIKANQLKKAIENGATQRTAERIVGWEYNENWCEDQAVRAEVPILLVPLQNGEAVEMERSSSGKRWYWSGHLGGLRASLLQQWLSDAGITFSTDY